MASKTRSGMAIVSEKRNFWFSLWRPAFAAPAFAALLIVVGYQNFVTFPALRQSANEPSLAPVAPLHSATRGATLPTVTADRKHGEVLLADPAGRPGRRRPAASYSFDLRDPQGKLAWTGSLPATAQGTSSDQSFSVTIPGSMLQNGLYSLVVTSVTAHKGGRIPVERGHNFDIVMTGTSSIPENSGMGPLCASPSSRVLSGQNSSQCTIGHLRRNVCRQGEQEYDNVRDPERQQTHHYHAEATILSGHLRLPLEHHIKPQVHTHLPKEGGYFSHRAEHFMLESVISFRSAHTHVAEENINPKPGGVLGHIGNNCNRGVERNGGGDRRLLSSDKRSPSIPARATYRRSIFSVRALRTCASPVFRSNSSSIRISLDPSRRTTRPTTSRPRIDWAHPQPDGPRWRTPGSSRRGSATIHRTFRSSWIASRRREVECSLVNRATGAYPGHSSGHVITIPDFGTILLGKVTIEHEDFKPETGVPKKTTVRLTMIDFALWMSGSLGNGGTGIRSANGDNGAIAPVTSAAGRSAASPDFAHPASAVSARPRFSCCPCLLLVLPLEDTRPARCARPRMTSVPGGRPSKRLSGAQPAGEAESAAKRYQPSDPSWASRFTLLEADSMLRRGMWPKTLLFHVTSTLSRFCDTAAPDAGAYRKIGDRSCRAHASATKLQPPPAAEPR